jgi:hypothetical protein
VCGDLIDCYTFGIAIDIGERCGPYFGPVFGCDAA